MLGRRVPDLGWSSKRRAVRRQKAVGQGVGRAGQLESGEGAGGTQVYFHFEAKQKKVKKMFYKSMQSFTFLNKILNTQTEGLVREVISQCGRRDEETTTAAESHGGDTVRDENKDKSLKLLTAKSCNRVSSHSCKISESQSVLL